MFLFSSQAIRMFFAGCPQSVPPASPWGYGLVSSALLGLCLLVNAPMAQAATGHSSTDVYVNGTKKTGTSDVVAVYQNNDTLIEIKSSLDGTGAFEPGSVTINDDFTDRVTLNNNKIVMTGGTMGFLADVPHDITAAQGGKILTNNQILISGGIITNAGEITMAGGYTFAGNSSAQGNKVEISGGAVIDGTQPLNKFTIYGAHAAGEVSKNTVTLKPDAGRVDGTATIVVYGGYSNSGTAKENMVNLGGGTGTVSVETVYGGYGYWATATDNAVSIDGSGGKVSVKTAHGGFSDVGSATGNSVSIKGGASGSVSAETVYGGYAAHGSATGNTVTIEGDTGSVSVGKLYGGYVENADNNNNVYGSATGNTVILSGAPGTSAEIYGGGAKNESKHDVRTGNTLKVYTKGISIAKLGNFQNYNFYLPSDIANGDTVLKVTNAVDISTPVGKAAKTSVGVGMQGGASLKLGDKITLINTTGGLTADSGMTNTLTARQGISREYNFTLSTDNNNLFATVGNNPGPTPPNPDPTPTPKPDPIQKTDEAIRKSPAEGRAASVSLVTQGADLASAQGMASAREAAKSMAAGANPLGIGGFAAMSGGVSRYNTGSHVDADGFSFMAGLAKRMPLSGVDLVAGVFFEAGFGSYSTYNNTAKDESIRGFGNNNYMGGGILGRMDITESALKGLYVETALRMGNIHTSYNSDDLNPALGRADYDTDSTYVGINAGLGYVWELSEKASLDLYGKYFWTHTSSADVEIFNDPVHFDAVNSHRTRFGARFAYQVNENISPYVGAAWEHEFDNNSRSTVAGDSIAAPTTKGSSGLGELGLTWKPSAESGLSVDLGAQGYAGVRQGVSGNLQMKYEF